VFFSSQAFAVTYRQHKPYVNDPIMKLLCSGVSLRRTAKLTGVCKGTAARKLAWLADQSRAAHQEFLQRAGARTSYVQFDEMETYEHSKLKPLSIALAVRAKNGDILDAQVATMNCHGWKARLSRRIYGSRQDTRPDACRRVMETVRSVSKPTMTVASDSRKTYPKIIHRVMPQAQLKPILSRAKMLSLAGAEKGFDPLFRLNHTAAKLRADIARLARRTWSASKKAECLQDHLMLYIAYNNGYHLPKWTTDGGAN
jgi:hypothetical protein